MKFRELRLLADENLNADVIDWLRLQGLDVVTVDEARLAGANDQSVLKYAFSQQRAVLTHDSDFGTLAIVGQVPFLGIVYLRPGHIMPGFTIGTIEALLSQDPELTVPFLVVARRRGDMVQIRIRTI